MSQERVLQIKNDLMKLGTEQNKLYTNEEIKEKLEQLQVEMTNGVFAVTHAAHFHAKDIMLHFNALAMEYGLESMPEYQRLNRNMSCLGYTIGGLIKGMVGEKKVKRALQLLKLDSRIKILFNVTIEEAVEMKTEYDAIIITPYGVFALEVKNYSSPMHITARGVIEELEGPKHSCDLGRKMNTKEYLLRKHLMAMAKVPYYGIMVYANEISTLVDDYKRVRISYCNTITQDIESYDTGKDHLNDDQIREIDLAIQSLNAPSKYPCKVRCEEIVEDYATLMTAIEEAADAKHAETIVDETELVSQLSKPVVQTRASNKGRFNWKRLLQYVTPVAGCLASAFLGYKVGVSIRTEV